jgi:hypothetical protein
VFATGLLIYWVFSKRPGPTTAGRREPLSDDAEAVVRS